MASRPPPAACKRARSCAFVPGALPPASPPAYAFVPGILPPAPPPARRSPTPGACVRARLVAPPAGRQRGAAPRPSRCPKRSSDSGVPSRQSSPCAITRDACTRARGGEPTGDGGGRARDGGNSGTGAGRAARASKGTPRHQWLCCWRTQVLHTAPRAKARTRGDGLMLYGLFFCARAVRRARRVERVGPHPGGVVGPRRVRDGDREAVAHAFVEPAAARVMWRASDPGAGCRGGGGQAGARPGGTRARAAANKGARPARRATVQRRRQRTPHMPATFQGSAAQQNTARH